MGLAEDILGAEDLGRQDITDQVPEWAAVLNGERLFVQVMGGDDRDNFELQIFQASPEGSINLHHLANARAKLCAKSLCDKDGKRLFTDVQAAALGRKNAVVLDRIFAVASKLNGLTEEDVAELEKNSEGGQSAATGSSSPGNSAARSPKRKAK